MRGAHRSTLRASVKAAVTTAVTAAVQTVTHRSSTAAAAAAAVAAERKRSGKAAGVELIHALLLTGGNTVVAALQLDRKLVLCLRAVAAVNDESLPVTAKPETAIGRWRRRRSSLKTGGKSMKAVEAQLTAVQKLAYKCLAMLGATEWKPKTRGQRGLRILCFDGGGTRGVLTIAMLKQIKEAVGKEPSELFDLIIGKFLTLINSHNYQIVVVLP
jgi:hypothetical protein